MQSTKRSIMLCPIELGGAILIINYNKLVRDKIPEIIRIIGDTPKTMTLDDETYFHCLNQKLKEEVDEYLEECSACELADILEVIYAIAAYKNLTPSDLENIRLKKHDERGGFSDKVFLVEVEREV